MKEINGLTEYKNLTSQQHENFYSVFERFIKEVRPERILEIGTANGGTTSALNDLMIEIGKSNSVRSYDVHSHSWYEDMRKRGIDLRVENIFNHDYDRLLDEKKNDVVSYIQQPGITVVLCDGGHKIGEFNELANYIKVGDYIMAHDYSETWEYFNDHIKDKIWNWCEIEEKYIEETCVKNNLHPYMKEEFQSIVWVCKVKE